MADPLLDCTPKAIRHRLARIKLKADQGNSASSSPAKTPNSKTGGGHGMKAKKRNANDIFDEESGDIKKVKQEHVQESDTEEWTSSTYSSTFSQGPYIWSLIYEKLEENPPYM